MVYPKDRYTFRVCRRFIDLFRLQKFDHVYVCMGNPITDSIFERLYLNFQNLIFDFDDAIHTKLILTIKAS